MKERELEFREKEQKRDEEFRKLTDAYQKRHTYDNTLAEHEKKLRELSLENLEMLEDLTKYVQHHR